jgi:hypothetical protein
MARGAGKGLLRKFLWPIGFHNWRGAGGGLNVRAFPTGCHMTQDGFVILKNRRLAPTLVASSHVVRTTL